MATMLGRILCKATETRWPFIDTTVDNLQSLLQGSFSGGTETDDDITLEVDAGGDLVAFIYGDFDADDFRLQVAEFAEQIAGIFEAGASWMVRNLDAGGDDHTSIGAVSACAIGTAEQPAINDPEDNQVIANGLAHQAAGLVIAALPDCNPAMANNIRTALAGVFLAELQGE